MNTLVEMINRKKDMPIASLIDVVFLLLVYFMVTSALVKKEADLSFLLPMPCGKLPDQPIELLVEINEPGTVMVEGEPFADRNTLFQRLKLLKAVADASGSELVVSVLPSDKTIHGAVIPVMDACAAAHIKNLSFVTSL